MKTLLLSLFALALLAPLGSAQKRAGSIYDPDRGPLLVGSNKTARRTGDLVTVVISENLDVKNEEKTDLTKQSDLDYALLDFDVKPNAFSTLPSVSTSKSDSFAGQGKVEKKGAFTARLTAIVIDTLPNGNLVIQGRRELRIDHEIKVIEFSGVCRRYDVRADNTVLSEFVADARVRYSGTGPMTNTQNRRGVSAWLHDALDWIWPF